MKKSKTPPLSVRLELNRKHGYGFQARMVMSDIESVLDDQPLTFSEIYANAYHAIKLINKQSGYKYKPYEIIQVANEALQANKHSDFTAAQMLQDIERGRGELSVPCGVDYCTAKVDGEDEIMLSGRGVVLMVFSAWRDDKAPKAREALQRYCQHLAAHGYGGGASEIWDELEKMNIDRGTNWIKATYNKYVQNDAVFINLILNCR